MDRISELLVSFLSGSLVSGIVTKLIQRYYQKKDEQRDLYKNLRSKLCHYKDDIDNILNLFYRNTYHHCRLINKKADKLNKEINEINLQKSTLNIQYKECTACEKQNADKCSFITDAINTINQKINSIIKEYNEIKQETYDIENNYWQSNENIYNIISSHKNLINDLGVIRSKSYIFIRLIREIDNNTTQILLLIQNNKVESNMIVEHCIKLIKIIDKALIQLDKDNN